MRLDRAIFTVVNANPVDMRVQVGKLLWDESHRAFWQCDIPAALRDMPWTVSLTRHKELFPERKTNFGAFSDAVAAYLAERRGRTA